MAVEDKVGFQEFSRAVYDIPPREQIEEASAIAQNMLEGHQAVGQGLTDPYTHAVHYLEKHRIVEIMQNLTSRIAFERPENPLQFMLDEIAKVQRGESLEELLKPKSKLLEEVVKAGSKSSRGESLEEPGSTHRN